MPFMNRVRTMACVLIAVTLVITSFGPARAASEASRIFIVTYVEGTDLNSEKQLLTTLLGLQGVQVTYVLTVSNALAIKIPLGSVDYVLGLLDPLNSDLLNVINDNVAGIYDDVLTFIDPICPTTALAVGSEYRWGMEQIKAQAAHDDLGPDPSQPGVVTVAVLDTGIASHSDLNKRIVQGYDAIDETEGKPSDGHGHGTHMAGIILANLNNGGVVGVSGVKPVAPRVVVAPVKVLANDGTGYLSAVINGLQWVFNNRDNRGIRLVNMSFGFSFSNESDDNPLIRAIQKLFTAGIIMVASAGNACCAGGVCEDGGGDDCGPGATCTPSGTSMTAPAAYPQVIAVGAIDSNRQIPTYSAYSGPGPDVLAPGGAPLPGAPDDGEILSTNNVGYGRGHGTSQAAAHVTGAIALAWSLEPGLSAQAVRNLVTQNKQNDVLNVENMINALLP